MVLAEGDLEASGHREVAGSSTLLNAGLRALSLTWKAFPDIYVPGACPGLGWDHPHPYRSKAEGCSQIWS